MEPRSCGYLHFIAVSRGGEVIKVLNTSRVKKVPKFKSVEEIYGSNARCPPKVSRSLAEPYGCDEVMRAVKIEATEEGEPDFDAMTLKQFAKTCKSKKRKAFPSVNLMEVKQEYTCSEHQENASALTETLGSWKRKLFKKRKAKKGITKSNTLQGKSNAPLHDQIRIKVEDIELDCLEPQPISCILPDHPRNDTGEIPGGTEYCSDGNIGTTLSGFQSTYQHPLSSFPEAQFGCLNEASHEHLESDHPVIPVVRADSEIEHVEKDHDTIVTDQHLDSPEVELRKEEGPTDVIMGDEAAVRDENCAVNTVSYEHLLTSEDSKTEEAIELNGERVSSDNSMTSPVSNLTIEEGMSTQMTHDEAPVLAENSVLNRTSYEHLEPSPLQNPLMSEDSKSEETIEFSVEAVTSDKSLATPVVSELSREEGTSVPMTCVEAPETVFSECDRSDHQDYSLPNDDSVFVQAPCTVPDTICQKGESNDDEKPSDTKDESKDIDSEVIRSEAVQQGSSVKSTACLPSANNMALKGNAGLPVEEKQSLMHNTTATHITRLRDIQPCGFITDQKFYGSSASESCLRNVPHPPERLFSARKTISPNSQERLCRVMNSVEAQEKVDIHSCKEKLPFEQYYKDKSSSSNPGVRRSRIVFTSRRLEAVSNNIRQSLRKGKDERKGFHCKDVAKGPNGSQNPVSGRGSPVQSRPQSAIQFSQRQMSDIERIAQRLMAQVQSMKDIFVDALQGESRPGAKLRYNTDQVREAVENATKAEESTKRFLTMMTRDCNRFCKIMRLAEDYEVPLKLAEDEAGSPEKTGQKGRKITFADEAGRSLCDVRLFETATAEACNSVEFQVKEESLGA